jgi:hypothetical protein
LKFWIFSHTPFHHLQICQLIASSECEIVNDGILGLDKLPYAKMEIDADEELFDLMKGLPGISVQDSSQPLDI